ncbi:2-oxo-4-hydroxy-4-carboxy-5-ureidoimidazoline decarboxylase [Pradoshia sp.]
MYQLEEINEMDERAFTAVLGDIFEKTPWVAKRAYEEKPFRSKTELYRQMVQLVSEAGQEEQLALIKRHPNLGEQIQMSDYSAGEQSQAGLHRLNESEAAVFQELNKAYIQTFSFPFILAVRGKRKEEILKEMKERLEQSAEVEFQTALTQIYLIAGFRLNDLIIGKEEGQ